MEWARCETVTAGVADQPFDVISALLGVAVGVWLLRRGHHLVGGALAGSSLASVAYHGTGSDLAAWLDALGVVLVAFAFIVDARRTPPVVATAGALLLAVLVAVDAARIPTTGLMVAAAVVLVVVDGDLDRAAVGWATVLFAAGVGAWVLAADDDLCGPDGWFPTHAAWHLLAIAGVAAAASARRALAATT